MALLCVSSMTALHKSILNSSFESATERAGLNCKLAVTLFVNIDSRATQMCSILAPPPAKDASTALHRHIHNLPSEGIIQEVDRIGI